MPPLSPLPTRPPFALNSALLTAPRPAGTLTVMRPALLYALARVCRRFRDLAMASVRALASGAVPLPISPAADATAGSSPSPPAHSPLAPLLLRCAPSLRWLDLSGQRSATLARAVVVTLAATPLPALRRLSLDVWPDALATLGAPAQHQQDGAVAATGVASEASSEAATAWWTRLAAQCPSLSALALRVRTVESEAATATPTLDLAVLGPLTARLEALTLVRCTCLLDHGCRCAAAATDAIAALRVVGWAALAPARLRHLHLIGVSLAATLANVPAPLLRGLRSLTIVDAAVHAQTTTAAPATFDAALAPLEAAACADLRNLRLLHVTALPTAPALQRLLARSPALTDVALAFAVPVTSPAIRDALLAAACEGLVATAPALVSLRLSFATATPTATPSDTDTPAARPPASFAALAALPTARLRVFELSGAALADADATPLAAALPTSLERVILRRNCFRSATDVLGALCARCALLTTADLAGCADLRDFLRFMLSGHQARHAARSTKGMSSASAISAALPPPQVVASPRAIILRGTAFTDQALVELCEQFGRPLRLLDVGACPALTTGALMTLLRGAPALRALGLAHLPWVQAADALRLMQLRHLHRLDVIPQALLLAGTEGAGEATAKAATSLATEASAKGKGAGAPRTPVAGTGAASLVGQLLPQLRQLEWVRVGRASTSLVGGLHRAMPSLVVAAAGGITDDDVATRRLREVADERRQRRDAAGDDDGAAGSSDGDNDDRSEGEHTGTDAAGSRGGSRTGSAGTGGEKEEGAPSETAEKEEEGSEDSEGDTAETRHQAALRKQAVAKAMATALQPPAATRAKRGLLPRQRDVATPKQTQAAKANVKSACKGRKGKQAKRAAAASSAAPRRWTHDDDEE